MKIRIISGVVMVILVSAIIALGIIVSPLFVTVFIAALAAVGTYEMLKNAGGIKSRVAVFGASIYSFLNVIALNTDICTFSSSLKGFNSTISGFYDGITQYMLSIIISVVFFIFGAVLILINHKRFSMSHIALLIGFPLPLSFAFSCLVSIINNETGIYYLLLLLNFSSICDMGAYFIGSSMGKHKLCPGISPHKTIEGAVGGIVSSLIVTTIIVFAFSLQKKLIAALIITIPFCILGMIGDLFASSIKRAAGIKDYGNLIPGHGGVLDRLDSILMLAPLYYLLIVLGVS